MYKKLLCHAKGGILTNSLRMLNNGGKTRIRKKYETYYDILQVPRDSDMKEIRSAFLDLSKKFHPDTNVIKNSRQKSDEFVKIAEAYQTLSRPRLRSAYDERLWCIADEFTTEYNCRCYDDMFVKVFAKDARPCPKVITKPEPPYGVEGWKRVSNRKIAMIIVAVTTFTSAIGISLFKAAYNSRRKILEQKSIEASNYLAAVKADAEKFSNEEQLNRLKARMSTDT